MRLADRYSLPFLLLPARLRANLQNAVFSDNLLYGSLPYASRPLTSLALTNAILDFSGNLMCCCLNVTSFDPVTLTYEGSGAVDWSAPRLPVFLKQVCRQGTRAPQQ